MSGHRGETGFDVPALRPQDWRRQQRPADVRPGARLSRGECAAAQLIAIAKAAAPGDRLGSKEELRARCEVSVGTFNEAISIAQSRGIISVRPGPGGGVFAATQSPDGAPGQLRPRPRRRADTPWPRRCGSVTRWIRC